MPRTYKSKNVYRKYSQDALNAAIASVRSGDNTPSAASRLFNIPRKTIADHLKTQRKHTSSGKPTIFTSTQEDEISKRLVYLEKRGFPLPISGLLEAAYKYACTLQRRKELEGCIPKNWHTFKRCSRDWWFSFRMRHPELSLRKPQGLSAARAQAFNPQRVDDFYDELKNIYEELDLQNFPQLIYNIDETGLSTIPNAPSRVIASKGSRTVQAIQTGERGTLTTIIPTINAAGDCFPPFVIMKGGVVADEIHQLYPSAKFVNTKSGYIDNEIFISFLHFFQDNRIKIPGKKCLLFLDGHASHLAKDAIEFCIANDIELFCLPPHSSHRLQPLDTHFNKPLKSAWTKKIEEFFRVNCETTVSRMTFVNLLKSCYGEMEKKRGLIVDAFMFCGLFPLNTRAVTPAEFSKSFSFQKESVEQSKRTKTVAETSDLVPENLSSASDMLPSTSSSVRNAFESPQKASNATHTKKHTATGSQLMKIREMKTMKVKLKFCDSLKSRSTKIKGRCEQSGTSLKEPSKSDECCVCAADFKDGENILDWFHCVECFSWACENCISVTKCFHCES